MFASTNTHSQYPPESHLESYHGHMHRLSMIFFLFTCLFCIVAMSGGVCLFHHPLSHLGSRGRESHAPPPHQPPAPPPSTPPPRPLHLFFFHLFSPTYTSAAPRCNQLSRVMRYEVSPQCFAPLPSPPPLSDSPTKTSQLDTFVCEMTLGEKVFHEQRETGRK